MTEGSQGLAAPQDPRQKRRGFPALTDTSRERSDAPEPRASSSRSPNEPARARRRPTETPR